MKIEKTCCDRCGKEVFQRKLFNLRGRPLKTVIEQKVSIPGSLFFTDINTKTFDLCYECTIELREFLNIDENTCIPHVNYRPCNDDVFYLCDRKACNNCHEECKHTSDIRHAVNFYQPHELDPDKSAYFELEMVDGKKKEKENEEA